MKHLTEHRFEDIAYFEPFYLKDFITSKPVKKSQGNNWSVNCQFIRRMMKKLFRILLYSFCSYTGVHRAGFTHTSREKKYNIPFIMD